MIGLHPALQNFTFTGIRQKHMKYGKSHARLQVVNAQVSRVDAAMQIQKSGNIGNSLMEELE